MFFFTFLDGKIVLDFHGKHGIFDGKHGVFDGKHGVFDGKHGKVMGIQDSDSNSGFPGLSLGGILMLVTWENTCMGQIKKMMTP